MTEQELIQGYETEIHYQKHMIENLGRWFTLLCHCQYRSCSDLLLS